MLFSLFCLPQKEGELMRSVMSGLVLSLLGSYHWRSPAGTDESLGWLFCLFWCLECDSTTTLSCFHFQFIKFAAIVSTFWRCPLQKTTQHFIFCPPAFDPDKRPCLVWVCTRRQTLWFELIRLICPVWTHFATNQRVKVLSSPVCRGFIELKDWMGVAWGTEPVRVHLHLYLKKKLCEWSWI